MAPDLAEPHVARGLALALIDRFADAEHALETALQINSNLYEANYFYARLCVMLGKLEQAARLFERASGIDPQEYQATVQHAIMHLGLGRLETAKAYYREGFMRIERHLELSPDDARAIIYGGGCLLRLGEDERGLAWIRRGRAMDPQDPVVVWAAACTFTIGGAHEDALDCLEQAVALGMANRGWFLHDPDIDPLRSHPRYLMLLESI